MTPRAAQTEVIQVDAIEAAAPKSTPARVIPSRAVPPHAYDAEPVEPAAEPPSAIVVAGAVGGSGTTSIALLVGLTLAAQEQRKVLVLDAAPAGGDLTARVFGTIDGGDQWDSWARAGADLGVLDWQLGGRDSGTAVLGSDRLAPDAAQLLATLMDAMAANGWIIVVDAGSGAPGSAVLAAARATGAALVLTMPQRADAANRARWFLSRLSQRWGDDLVAGAVVAVTDQDGKDSYVFRAVADGLFGKVSDIVLIPTDAHLATGLAISPDNINAATRGAVTDLIAIVSEHHAARRPRRPVPPSRAAARHRAPRPAPPSAPRTPPGQDPAPHHSRRPPEPATSYRD